MSDTTTTYQGQKRPPITLDGSYLGSRVTLTWKTSRGFEGFAVGRLEAVHHDLEPHWRDWSTVVTTARLAGMPTPLTITGWGEAQPLEPNATPSN